MISHAPTEIRPAPAWRSVLPRLLAGLALLGIAMTGTAAMAPTLALRTSGADHPGYAVLAGTGVALILLSSLFLAYASRVIGLGAAGLVLALLANALFLIGRLVLAPAAFYRTTFVEGDPLLNVRSPWFFPLLAAGLLVLSAAVVGVLYAWAHGSLAQQLGRDRERLERHDTTVSLLTAALALGVLVLVLSIPSLIGYGVVVMAATGGAAILLGLITLALGTGTMWQAASDSVSLRSTAVLTSAFWLALSLLLVYHVVWVVFMAVLVSLWPLKVVAPSGK